MCGIVGMCSGRRRPRSLSLASLAFLRCWQYVADVLSMSQGGANFL
jgi:hypothetical protein